MKCPYLTRTVMAVFHAPSRITEYLPEAPAIEPITIETTDWTQVETIAPQECLMNDCAAWQDGRCFYSGH